MTGALHQAWVSDEKENYADFTSAFDPSMAEFGAESMRDRRILSMDKPLEQIQSVEVVFYDTLGRPNDESYVLIGLEEPFIQVTEIIPWIRSGQEAISGILLVFKYSAFIQRMMLRKK